MRKVEHWLQAKPVVRYLLLFVFMTLIVLLIKHLTPKVLESNLLLAILTISLLTTGFILAVRAYRQGG